jgi:XTP/dITP diphosphohydrolase
MELVIASTSVHKIRELRSMLKEVPGLDVLSLLDFPDYKALPETGDSFEENATTKAVHAAATLHRTVLADDSGLVVPALGGAPGVYSARYAGEGSTDAENRRKLLKEMTLLQEAQRAGYYECFLALATPEGLKAGSKGRCEGIILTKEQGGQGFGYDPLFQKYEYAKSFGELDAETKNRISHRRKAFDKIKPALEAIKQ